jgi:hypothetical protein
MSRPSRTRALDELGRWMTLPAGPETFLRLGTGASLLFLGLGPDISVAAALASGAGTVLYFERPGFEASMGTEWVSSIPGKWQKISPDDDIPHLDRGTTVLLYAPNLKLEPSFWAPLWARCKLLLAGVAQAKPGSAKEVWLPGNERDLLLHELENAFRGRGFVPRRVPAPDIGQLLLDGTHGAPALVLSINFRGLDPLGGTYHLLRKAGVPVAVWCVDNPFHLLSGLRSSFWRQCPLMVSDSWFVDQLRAQGASRVRYLPLATDPALFRPREDHHWAELGSKAVFVGRSRFPGKERFFAGCAVPSLLEADAQAMLRAGARSDFGWWLDRLGPVEVWPETGSGGMRRVGFCAEESTRAWRSMVLGAVAEAAPLTVVGDAEWSALLPPAAGLLPEVDYYGSLTHIYEHAGVSLNLTSLLLPRGLNQRHFDVWAAGGFLLTDQTPGLSLFPARLTRHVAFASPAEAVSMTARFLRDPAARLDISLLWRDEILKHHTYASRVDEILEWVYQPIP